MSDCNLSLDYKTSQQSVVLKSLCKCSVHVYRSSCSDSEMQSEVALDKACRIISGNQLSLVLLLNLIDIKHISLRKFVDFHNSIGLLYMHFVYTCKLIP